MPQAREFHVLQCYDCESFQVHIMKKVAKWTCKMCGEKQSIKKVFTTGNGKDCRMQVQELNETRIKKAENVQSRKRVHADICTLEESNSERVKGESKWAEFLEGTETEEESHVIDTKVMKKTRLKCEFNEDIKNNLDTLLRKSGGLGSDCPNAKERQSWKRKASMFEPDVNDLDSFLRM